MILPVVAYGHPVLKKIAEEIDQDYPGLQQLIADMFETMYRTEGVGLAAPQINKSIRLFVIDAEPFVETYPEAKGFKKVFINPEIVDHSEETWTFREGCLSLPDMNEDVTRPAKVTVNYLDENFEEHEEELDGICARVFQHEFDHLEGKVYVDRVAPMRKMMAKKNNKRASALFMDF
jgi:peptide deformylase